MAVWDTWSTFSELAGVDPTDHRAAKAGLPPIDSVSMLDYIAGTSDASPRSELPMGSTGKHHDEWDSDWHTIVKGVIKTDLEQGKKYKLLMYDIPMATWSGPQFPNATTSKEEKFDDIYEHCGLDGCLFELSSDPTEHVNLAEQLPQVRASMMDVLKKHNSTVFAPNRGKEDPGACEAALSKYNGHWGPWVDV